jgi:hypothetical protein
MQKFSQHLGIALVTSQEHPEVDSRVVLCVFCTAETQSHFGGYPVCRTCSDELEKRELPEPGQLYEQDWSKSARFFVGGRALCEIPRVRAFDLAIKEA